jgi:hypothetical protein
MATATAMFMERFGDLAGLSAKLRLGLVLGLT